MMDIYIVCKKLAQDSYTPHKAFLTEEEAEQFVKENNKQAFMDYPDYNILPSVLILGGVR